MVTSRARGRLARVGDAGQVRGKLLSRLVLVRVLHASVRGRPFCSCPPFGNERTCHVNPLHRILARPVPSGPFPRRHKQTDSRLSPDRTCMACPCCMRASVSARPSRARPASEPVVLPVVPLILLLALNCAIGDQLEYSYLIFFVCARECGRGSVEI
jgi:hypothetical protein